MTQYALINDTLTGVVAYPYSFSDLRAAKPHLCFPTDPPDALLATHFVYPVVSQAKPIHDPVTEDVVEGTPVKVGDEWHQSWTVVPAPPDVVDQRQLEATTTESRSEVLTDTFVSAFTAMSPAEVSAYVNANVTDMASAKALLNKMALMLLILARREFL